MATLFLTAAALLGYHEAGSLLQPFEKIFGINSLHNGGVRSEWAFFAELGAIVFTGFFLAFFLPLLKPRTSLLMVLLLACALGSAALSSQYEMRGLRFGYAILLLFAGYYVSVLLSKRQEAEPRAAIEQADSSREADKPDIHEAAPHIQPLPDAPASNISSPATDATLAESTESIVSVAGELSTAVEDVETAVPHVEIASVGQNTSGGIALEPVADADLPPEAAAVLQLGSFALMPNPVSGPFGLVYQGKNAHGQIAKIYTIPLAQIPPHEQDAFRKRMTMYADMLGRLSHSRIARVLESGESADIAYVAYEEIKGTPLSEYCNKGSLMSFQDALALIAKIAEAVDLAHKNGLIHRAIRPETILLSHDGEVLMTEFGLAAIVNSGGDGLPLEIIPYTAPEVVFGRKADGRADLFSLGAVFFELLTGERLIAGDIRADLFYQITTKPYRQISEIRPDLPEFCDILLDRMVAKLREQRYQLSVDLSDDIAMLLYNL
ncbi:MAG: serine/threonine protein kinase bacterial [Nitrospirae bacterium]|nr:MAG: serine/threonine protein kinase bacterial [Nitrospirota bacterium]